LNKSDLEIEVTINNLLGVVNSQLIKSYMELHPKVQDFCKIIKIMAKRSISNNFLMTSYAITLMAIYFL
jgi:DNA polymerase sigma